MIGKSPTVYQTSHALLREALHTVLRATVESGLGTFGVECRATAVVHLLLFEHAVDRRGRCRLCRPPGAVIGRRRRRCRVYVLACYWLHQPDERLLLSHLAGELHRYGTPD